MRGAAATYAHASAASVLRFKLVDHLVQDVDGLDFDARVQKYASQQRGVRPVVRAAYEHKPSSAAKAKVVDALR